MLANVLATNAAVDPRGAHLRRNKSNHFDSHASRRTRDHFRSLLDICGIQILEFGLRDFDELCLRYTADLLSPCIVSARRDLRCLLQEY